MSENEKCCERIRIKNGGWRPTYKPCPRRGKVQREGQWYCGLHDPEAVRERKAASAAKFEVGYQARQATYRLQQAAPDLLAALKGVLRVADRDTVEFDAARDAIAKAEGRKS